MAKPKTPEMLYCLTAHGHRHVWAPVNITEAELAADPDLTPEEVGMVHCFQTYGVSCGARAVRDQAGKLVKR
jgi:hypothetical protein